MYTIAWFPFNVNVNPCQLLYVFVKLINNFPNNLFNGFCGRLPVYMGRWRGAATRVPVSQQRQTGLKFYEENSQKHG